MKKIVDVKEIWLFIALCFLYGCSAMTRGDIRLNAGMAEAAIPHYQERLREKPDDWKARQKLGVACYKAGQYPKAVEELEKTSAAMPDDPDTVYYLGLARAKKGEPLKAARTLQSFPHPGEEVQQKVDQSVTLLKIKGNMEWAREALENEARLKTRPPQPNSIAVCYYKDISPDNQFKYLQKALTEMIITDLSHVKTLTVVERVRLQRLLEEMEMGTTGIVDKTTAPRAGNLLGAEHLVIGTLETGSIVSKTGVASTSKKEMVAAFSLTDDHGNFFQLQKKIVNNILSVLNVSLTPGEKSLVAEEHTRSFQAAAYYGRALDAQDRGDWKEAKQYYQKALKEDPNFKLAFWGSEGCPGGDAPGVGDLGGMSDAELGDYVEASISGAVSRHESAVQARIESDAKGGGDSDPESGAPGRGDISVSW